MRSAWKKESGNVPKAPQNCHQPRRGHYAKSRAVAPLELVATGKTLVVGRNPGGVFISDDYGKTWQDGSAGLPVNAPVWTLAAGEERVFVGTTGKLKLGTGDIGLFASKDRASRGPEATRDCRHPARR